MRLAILDPLRWQANHAPGKVNLRPPQCADLLTTLACQDQELHDGPIGIVAGGVPDFNKLHLSEHSVARLQDQVRVGCQDWICIDHPFFHGPSEEARERRASSVSRTGTSLCCDFTEDCGDGPAINPRQREWM